MKKQRLMGLNEGGLLFGIVIGSIVGLSVGVVDLLFRGSFDLVLFICLFLIGEFLGVIAGLISEISWIESLEDKTE